ncbi:MAG: Uma2 family endonuclease [Bacteroidota bacterium]
MAPPALAFQDRYTYSDYSQWDDGERWELIEGIAYNMTPAPNRRHQELLSALFLLIGPGIKGKNCHIYTAPFDVRLPQVGESADETDTVVQPDLSVFCGKDRLDDKGATGAPDWVIEILSPSTAKKDMTVKTMLYQKHGVNEYWLVDPEKEEITVNLLGSTTLQYDIPSIFERKDSITQSGFPDLVVELEGVFGE